jgi:hypothetical protein
VSDPSGPGTNGPYTIDAFTPADVAVNLRGLADDLDGGTADALDEADLADLMMLSMLARSIVERAGGAPAAQPAEAGPAAEAPDEAAAPRMMALAAGMTGPSYRNLRPRPRRRR